MGATNLSELAEWAQELVERSPLGHLSYLDDSDHPRVLPVTFAVAGGDLWTAIDKKPKRKPPDQIARVRYLRRRSEAALCVDHYSDDWSRLAWVQVIGAVDVLGVDDEDEKPEEPLDGLREKYEAYVEDPPEGPLLRLRPQRVICWRASGD